MYYVCVLHIHDDIYLYTLYIHNYMCVYTHVHVPRVYTHSIDVTLAHQCLCWKLGSKKYTYILQYTLI